MFEVRFQSIATKFAAVWPGLLVMVGLAGCATPPAPAPSTMDLSAPTWTIREGQAVWKPRPDRAGIAGDLMVALCQDGRSLVQFSKTPVPIALAELGSNNWRVTFAAERRTKQGAGAPPDDVLWLQFPDGLLGRHSTTNWYFAKTKDDAWHFENLVTEEALDGYLTTVRLPRLHLVREGETLNRITRFYGVSAAELRAVNPGATVNWIRPGNIIALPQIPAPAAAERAP